MTPRLTPRVHGVLTLVLLLLALLTGIVGIARLAVLPAVLYGLMIAAGLPLIVYLFCGKCVCRGERCLMVLPGRLSMRLPDRRGEAYTRADAAGIVGILVLLAVFPLYWLWQTTALFVLFGVLAMAAHAEVLLVVCRSCGNCRCPVNKWFRGKGLMTGA
jgi:hypothetical protein